MKWLLLAILSLVWGSSFILMKRGLFQHGEPALSPVQLASARLFIAWLVLLPLLMTLLAAVFINLNTTW